MEKMNAEKEKKTIVYEAKKIAFGYILKMQR